MKAAEADAAGPEEVRKEDEKATAAVPNGVDHSSSQVLRPRGGAGAGESRSSAVS